MFTTSNSGTLIEKISKMCTSQNALPLFECSHDHHVATGYSTLIKAQYEWQSSWCDAVSSSRVVSAQPVEMPSNKKLSQITGLPQCTVQDGMLEAEDQETIKVVDKTW